eukprot:TRINITY_DN13736_c0_g1_i1.p1 TRINITY_DN13736_c0_g1~~TRINITY_DN13736_c0_g1_i1.p1  ORF type:complete len:210 (-),score=37.83 TRINITY_DN13736_c0_g1_i1:41-670(-)
MAHAVPLVPATPLPGYPDVLVGTQDDAADVLAGENMLGVAAVVNCARDDWLFKVQHGKCGDAALRRFRDLEASIKALTSADGESFTGEVCGVRYCTVPARDRDRSDPIIISGEVAVPGLEPYDMGKHLPATASFIREQVAAGRRVLIHCLRGENRAGAVAAAFLIADSPADADAAVEKVREARGRFALSNKAFVEQVHAFAANIKPSTT